MQPDMAKLECKSSQRGIASEWVIVDHITDEEVSQARGLIDTYLATEKQPSDAVAFAFLGIVTMCPNANPSDLWQHVLYRHLLENHLNDQQWKRVSGFALERAFVRHYAPLLAVHDVRMRILPASEANKVLHKLGVADTKATKVDVFLEGRRGDNWLVFGAAHVKSSIAERIQDDVPASRAFMDCGLRSVALTMDAKSYPPPHGNCINYGELGGRSLGIEKERLKRGYIEDAGQFDALFSFNLRTPPSPAKTPSGKRIYAMSFHDKPDQLVTFLAQCWENHPNVIAT
jgi:hypothetical protein